MKRKSKEVSVEQMKSWEKTAALFEDEKESLKIMKASRVLSATEKRRLFGPGKTKQISVRLPEEDLQAVKEIAEANSRPYQQLVVVAVQQYLDRVADQLQVKPGKRAKAVA
jgi:predicted DNA binding CopG/RHH family protein